MIRCSGAYALVSSMASFILSTTISLLLARDFSAISLRGSKASWRSTSTFTACCNSTEVVINTAWLSTPCSAWLNKSAATKTGLAVSSANTSTSEGPAGISIATSRKLTSCLAAVTY